MAVIPQALSFQQVYGGMLDSYLSRLGLKTLDITDPINFAFISAAQADIRSTQNIFNLLAASSLQNSKGLALDRIGADENVPRRGATYASGTVNIIDGSFTKISTTVYAGAAAPNAGTSTLLVASGASFPTTGSIYIGRGTVNIEGPIAYTAVSQIGSYWSLTLSTSTQQFHNTNETVVLAQGGDRVVAAGTVYQTQQGALTSSVSYSQTYLQTIPDGEVEVDNIAVTCQQAGSIGNVPAGAISTVVSSSLQALTVINPLPISNALDVQDDDDYRVTIQNTRQTRSRGTPLAIITNSIGVISPDENKTVVSANIVSVPTEPSVLYIDDGTGYEELDQGVALETVVDQALGGEYVFTLAADPPLTKAFVATTLSAPFSLVPGATIAFSIAGLTTSHSFSADEFLSIGNATPLEVASAINADPAVLFQARVAANGNQVVVFAKADTNEDIAYVTPPNAAIDANTFLGFPTGINYTLRLYKNDVLLYKDGLPATIYSTLQSTWSQAMASGIELEVSVDGTPGGAYTFYDADFITAKTGYTTLSTNNSLASWAAVFNAKIPGITATVNGASLTFTSNLGLSARAAIVFSAPNGVTNNLIQYGMFSSAIGLASTGRPIDYALDRNHGTIKVFTPLSVGDTLSAGSKALRAYVQSAQIPSSTVTFTTPATLWVAVDSGATIQGTGVNGATAFTIASTTNPQGVRYTASGSNVFGTGGTAFIAQGDWVIIWDPNFNVLGSWRISAVDPSFQYFEIERPLEPSAQRQSGVTLANGGMVFVRSKSPIQTIRFPAGSSIALSTLVTQINGVLNGTTASVYRNQYLRFTTNTYASVGDIGIVAADLAGQVLGFDVGEIVANSSNHAATVESGNEVIGTPSMYFENVASIQAYDQFTASDSNLSSGGLLYWVPRLSTSTYTSFSKQAFTFDSCTAASTAVTVEYPDVSYSVAIGGMVLATNVVTVATSTPHDFRVGDFVYLSPVSTLDSNFPAGYKLVTAVPSSSSFSYPQVASNNTSVQPYNVGRDFGLLVNDQVTSVLPYAIGPSDTLNVVLDGDDVNKNYSLPMWRRIAPAGGAAYGTSAFGVVDADNGNAALSTAFGSVTPTIFNDFALFMQARGKSDAAGGTQSNKALLWRYGRLGPEGNNVTVAFTNPTAPSLGFSYNTVNGSTAAINVQLPSSAARTSLALTNTTYWTIAVSTATPQAYTDTVTYTYSKLTISSGSTWARTGAITVSAQTTTAHGFAVGDVVYVSGSTDSNFPNGPKNVATTPTGTTFTYLEPGSNVNSMSSAFVSEASSDVSLTSVTAGDIVTIARGTAFNAANNGTFRVISKTSTSFTVYAPTGVAVVQTTPVSQVALGNIVFYPINTSLTTSALIATWVNANMGGLVTATAVDNGGGSPGTGTISIATADEYLAGTQNSTGGAIAAWPLFDGINWVSTSNIQTSASPNTISLKNAVTSDLTSNADFADEIMRLVPITDTQLEAWITNPGISGFYAGSEVVAAAKNRRLQLSSLTAGSAGSIQVLGGTANSAGASLVGSGSVVSSSYGLVTIPGAQSTGLIGGHWVALQAGISQPKATPWTSGSTIAAASNIVTFSNVVWTQRQNLTSTSDMWEIRQVGRFTSYTLIAPSDTISNSVIDGDWAVVSLAGASSANNGTFRVVQHWSSVNTFWVENPSGSSQLVSVAGSDSVAFYSYDSVMPGDIFHINTNIYGAANQGSYVVSAFGALDTQFVVLGSLGTISTTALSTNANLVTVTEAAPIRLVKKIWTIAQNPLNATYNDVVVTTSNLITKCGAGTQTVIQALDKLNFPIELESGVDAYTTAIGLIGELQKVLYGDLSNSAVYPGVIALGASCDIRGPLIRRVQVSIAIRLISNTGSKDVIANVQSAVAAAINSTPTGQSVAIGNIVAAAEAVTGVLSVAIISPTYSSSNDLIAVQPFQRARVINLNTDVLVSIIGS